jgi:hypothetical protein
LSRPAGARKGGGQRTRGTPSPRRQPPLVGPMKAQVNDYQFSQRTQMVARKIAATQ